MLQRIGSQLAISLGLPNTSLPSQGGGCCSAPGSVTVSAVPSSLAPLPLLSSVVAREAPSALLRGVHSGLHSGPAAAASPWAVGVGPVAPAPGAEWRRRFG